MGNCTSCCRRRKSTLIKATRVEVTDIKPEIIPPTTSARPNLVLNIDNNSPELTPQVTSALQINPHKRYIFGKLALGRGSQSEVFTASNKLTGNQVAIKTIKWKYRCDGQKRTCRHQQLTCRQLEMEIRCLQTLKHPGIVTLHETYIYEDAIYLVTEYLTGQELFQLVDQSQSGLPWKKVRRILYQLLQAIQHCHAKGITHRDISLDNIMIDSTNKVKLIDFGLATHQSPPYHDCLGTDYYIAPEVIRGKYDQLADIWSVGICWFCLATGRPPFHGRNRKHTFQLIQEGVWNFKRPQWKHYDRSAQTLLAGLLAYDPNKRWTAQQALNSPWFDQV